MLAVKNNIKNGEEKIMGLLKSKAKTVHIKFGVPYFDVFDCRFTDFSAPIAVRGEISFFVKNYEKFLKQNGFDGVSWDEFQSQIRSAVIRHVKDFIANAPSRYDIPVVQLEKKIEKLSRVLKLDLTSRIKKEFKIQVFNADITAIEVDVTSSGYKHLKSVTKDIVEDKIYMQSELEMEEMQERAKIDREDYQESLRQKREFKGKLQNLLIPFLAILGIAVLVLLVVIIKNI